METFHGLAAKRGNVKLVSQGLVYPYSLDRLDAQFSRNLVP